ncbi:hypothetical protein ACRAWD_08125 [Caulobacter segnis]
MLYVDPAAPVDRLRAPSWRRSPGPRRCRDGKVVNLAVAGLTAEVMEVRCLVSARNAPEDLRPALRGPREDDGFPARRTAGSLPETPPGPGGGRSVKASPLP